MVSVSCFPRTWLRTSRTPQCRPAGNSRSRVAERPKTNKIRTAPNRASHASAIIGRSSVGIASASMFRNLWIAVVWICEGKKEQGEDEIRQVVFVRSTSPRCDLFSLFPFDPPVAYLAATKRPFPDIWQGSVPPPLLSVPLKPLVAH